MKVGIYTLGCKVNAYESECVADLLKENGYEIVPFTEMCDIYIINTCSVTNTSDAKSRKIIHQAMRRNPDACIVAMGCFIEANKKNEIEGVDVLIGNRDKSKIVSLIEEYFKTKKQIKNLYDDLGTEFENMEIHSFGDKTRAFVKIQDGCENFCTYCIIPFVRGKCRSKEPDLVLQEITSLVNHGYQEIVLTGIHTGNYGVDIGTDFASLLEKILEIPKLYRLRISSIEQTELNDRVLELLKSPIIANHLHIPLQSGSMKIMKAMNRKYTKNEYLKKIEKIRKIRPDISISTDVIVGFPGETDEMFQESYQFCEEIVFSKIHVFPYSKRNGTAAACFPNQVDERIKKERVRKLTNLSSTLEKNYMEKFLGQEIEVLIERSDSEYSIGHTSNFLLVKVLGIFHQEERVLVNISRIEYPYCLGTICCKAEEAEEILVVNG